MSKAAYVGVDSIARKIKKMYVGVDTEVPVYETTTTTVTETLSAESVDSLFDVTEGGTSTTGWTISDDDSAEGSIVLENGNKFSGSGTATIEFQAKHDMTGVALDVSYSIYNGSTVSISANGATVLNTSTPGSSQTYAATIGDVQAGQSIQIAFVHSGNTRNDVVITLSSDDVVYDIISKVQIGTEIKPLARKVKKGYVGVNGVAKLFFTERFFEYTGDYTESDIDIDGVAYKLYTLTSSGTLKCSKSRFWMCGGGAGGQTGYTFNSDGYVTAGGGGGGGYIVSGYVNGVHSVIIGAGGTSDSNGGSTSCDEENALGGYCATGKNGATGGNGGSGGGAPVYVAVANYGWGNDDGGTGAGVSTYPFGIESLFGHCAGGGAGVTKCKYTSGDGYAGGTNGENGGGTSSSDISHTGTPGAGGEKGGGTGGRIPGYSEAATVINGGDATFFGSGAGGGGAYFYSEGSTSNKFGAGGIGYQGVMYVLQESA